MGARLRKTAAVVTLLGGLGLHHFYVDRPNNAKIAEMAETVRQKEVELREAKGAAYNLDKNINQWNSFQAEHKLPPQNVSTGKGLMPSEKSFTLKSEEVKSVVRLLEKSGGSAHDFASTTHMLELMNEELRGERIPLAEAIIRARDTVKPHNYHGGIYDISGKFGDAGSVIRAPHAYTVHQKFLEELENNPSLAKRLFEHFTDAKIDTFATGAKADSTSTRRGLKVKKLEF